MKSVRVAGYCSCDGVEGSEGLERPDGRSLAFGPIAVEADTSGGGQDLNLADGCREVAQADLAYCWW